MKEEREGRRFLVSVIFLVIEFKIVLRIFICKKDIGIKIIFLNLLF